MQDQAILKELETLVQKFHEAEIQMVVVKGACFALTIYPGIGLRPMGDLDILVPSDQLPLSVKIAQKLGFREINPEPSTGINDLLNHDVSL